MLKLNYTSQLSKCKLELEIGKSQLLVNYAEKVNFALFDEA